MINIQNTSKPQPKNFWDIFTAAPHRMMFFAGAVQLILPMIFWGIELSARYTSFFSPLDMRLPATWIHGFIMLYGIFSFFSFGFLMTTFPRWLNTQAIKKESYVSTFIWSFSGIVLFEIGVFYNITIAVIGLGLFLFGWAKAIYSLYTVYKKSTASNKKLEGLIISILIAGLLGAANFLLWLILSDWFYIQIGIQAGLWLFLVPLLFSVSHRMLPFFSSNVIKNYNITQIKWAPISVLFAGMLHMSLSLNHLPQWLFISDLPLSILAFYLSYKWRLIDSFCNSLLAVLHLSFIWLGIGMLLYGLQSLYLLISDEWILGKAPLHAITIGFISSMLIAMATRVTLGHSGRLLHIDKITVALFLAVQLAAISRILAEIPFFDNLLGLHLNIIAVSLWILSLGTWFIIYSPMYLTERTDGQTG